ncbi:MAG: response regulator [Lentilitoribacter sp.]
MANVLLLDDDFVLAQDYKEALEKAGHDITVTHTGLDAVNYCADRKFDILILDVFIKRGQSIASDGGLYCISQLRHNRTQRFVTSTNVPIIAISGAYSVKLNNLPLQSALTLGANATLTKPLNLNELIERISRFCV